MTLTSSTALALLLLACLSCAVIVRANDAKTSDVVVLDGDNFDQHTAQGDWFLEFYAPWCGHCKNLAPTWEDLATQTKSKGINVGKVDCTQNKDLGSRFNVRGYPTIQFLKDKQLYAYKGPRKVEDFLKFADEGYKAVSPVPFPTPVAEEPEVEDEELAEGSAPVHILTADNFTLATSGDKWFVKFYAPWCGHCKNLAPTWEKTAQKLTGKVNVAKLDCTTNAFVCQMFDIKGYPTLKFFKGDGYVRDYTGAREVSEFADFVKKTHQKATTHPYPLPSFLMSPTVFKFYKLMEPLADWINHNVGYAFALVALFSATFGFVIGKLTTSPEIRYVIPKELAPQWNELLAQKKASEERRRVRHEKRENKKNAANGASQGASAEAAPAPAPTSSETPTSSPRKKRSKGKKSSGKSE